MTISENGRTLFRNAMAKNGFQPDSVSGKLIRYAHSTGRRIRAASATRSSTTVSGGNSRSTTPWKKNEPPHSTESTASSNQSLASIRWSLEIICGSAIQDRADAYGKGRNAGHPIPETASRWRRSRPCADAAEMPHSVVQALLAQAKADSRRRRTFRAISGPAARTEHRYQRLVRLAARRAVSLHSPQAGNSGIALVALFAFFTLVALCAGRALRSLWTLRPGLSLSAGDPLDALGALRAGRPLCARLAFGPRISAASGQRKRNTNKQDWNNFHHGPQRKMNDRLQQRRPILGCKASWVQIELKPKRRFVRCDQLAVSPFGRDTISIILPSSSSGPWALARS